MEKAETSRGVWKILLQGTAATCQFELTRNFSVQRLMVAGILAFFPPAMMFLVLFGSRLVGSAVVPPAVEFLIVILISLVCFLALLLWASPVVDADLEGKTWVYIASRPMGRTSNLLGKMLASLMQTLAVCAIAIAGCTLIAALANAFPPNSGTLQRAAKLGSKEAVAAASISADYIQVLQFAGGLMLVFAVSAFVYNCVMTMLGVIFFRRAMVACVAWGLVSELFVANIPAVIRFGTVRYHVQELLIRWVGWPIPIRGEGIEFYRTVFGDFGVWLHLTILAGLSALCVGVALWRINRHEYLSAEDS